jgi:hypothetical protein
MSKLYVNTIAPQSGTDVNLEGSVKITGNLEVTGTLHAKTTDFIVSANSTTFGDAASDSLTFNASTGSVPNGFNFDSNTLVIDSSNNRIGIGVAAPTQALDVNGTVKATTFSGGSLSSTGDLTVGDDLLLQSDSAILSFGLGDDVSLTHTNDVGIHLNAAMRLGFRDQGGEYIYSVSDGNLGVVAATSIDLKSPQIDIGEDDTSDVTINLLGSTNDMAIVYDESAKVLNIDSNVLTVDGANNRVGIGTAAPAVDLEIKAEHPKLLFQSSEGSGNGDGQIIFKSTDGTQLANIRCDATSNALNHFGISAGSGEDDLVIDGSGNIGINDTTPSHRLDVNGTLRSTGIATFDANVVVSVDADADDTTADSATGRISTGVGADLNLYHGGTNSYVVNNTGDLIIATEGGSGGGVVLDAEDDTVEIKYSGVLGATFDGDGLDLVTGDAYQINGASVLNATTLGSAVVNSSLTSVGALTTLTVDNITINGTEIDSDSDLTVDVAGDLALSAEGGNVTMDDGTITVFDFDVDNVALKIMDDADTGDYFSIGVAANGATTLTTVDDDGAAANLIITADGTVDIDSAGTMTLDSGANINLEPAAGSHILLDGTIQVDAGVVTGATSVTVGSTVVTDDSIVMTPSTDDTVTIAAATNGALTITTVDTGAAAANIQITADGTFEVDATTITMDSSGTVVLDAASTAAAAIDINSAGGMDVDVADEINIATTSADGHISLVSAHTAGVAFHLDADANAGSIVDIDAGVLDIDVTGAATLDAASLTVTSDTVTFTSANANDPIVTIENTTADAAAPRLKFNKNRGADAVDADDVGDIQFWSYDDGTPSVQQYAGILAEVHDATSDEESGKLTLQVASHDGGLESGIILTGGSADAEVDVTIGAGADSLTTISGDLDIPNGGFALGSDASGDMYFRNASGVLTRIAVGSNNHVLTLDGAVPGWEAAAGGGAVSAVANGSDNRIATFSSSDALNGEANLTFDGTDLAATLDTATFTSANADDPLIIIKNTTNDASGARLRFVKDKGAAGAADDIAGIIEFYADDAAQDQVKFGSITSLVKVHTNGQEGGELVLEVASHDGESVPGLILVDGSGEDEIDVTIASGANSVTTIAGDAIVTGDVLSVTHYIQHEGDADTRLVFTANQMNVEVGGINAAKFTATELAINEAAGNVDFRVESQNESHMLFMDAANNRISIGDSANAPTATLEITNHASSGAFDVPLLQLNSNDVDQVALDINAANTTANIVDIVSDDALTTGKVINIDVNNATTTALTQVLTHVDFDKDGAAGGGVTQSFTGLVIDLNDAATNNGSSTVTMTGLDIAVDSASTDGTNTNVGLNIVATDATTNDGVRITAENGAGADIKMFSSANSADFATMSVGVNGETTIATVDGDSNLADLTLSVDGSTFIRNGSVAARGGGFDAGGSSVTSFVSKINGEHETTLLIDIAGLTSDGTNKEIIGDSGGTAAAFITQLTTAVNGLIYRATMACIEAPTTGEVDIDLVANSSNLAQGVAFDSTGTSVQMIAAGGDWALGMYEPSQKNPAGGNAMTAGLNNYYLYLAVGTDSSPTAGTYGAGKFIIKLYGSSF